MMAYMARSYKLSLRSSGVCAANAQAIWETLNSLWSTVQSGANLVYHAACWLEGRLIASPKKMDCEMLQQIQRYMELETYANTPDHIALKYITVVGSDGRFIGIQHT